MLCFLYSGIDGQEDMKLIYGIIAVEGKVSPGKVAKVIKLHAKFHLKCNINGLDISLTLLIFLLFYYINGWTYAVLCHLQFT